MINLMTTTTMVMMMMRTKEKDQSLKNSYTFEEVNANDY